MKKFRSVRPNLIPFIDYHTNLLLIFVILLLFASVKRADESIKLSEIYQLTMTWAPKSDTDMDLWVKDPTGNIVGFRNREGGEGSLFCLKRDDLGRRSDKGSDGKVVEINEEIVSLRGTKEGEYIVNGHCYLKPPGEQTVIVKASLTRIKPFKEIIFKERTFKLTGEEQTFFRFKLDEKGLVSETNELPGKVAISAEEEGDGEVDFDQPQIQTGTPPPSGLPLPSLPIPNLPIPPQSR